MKQITAIIVITITFLIIPFPLCSQLVFKASDTTLVYRFSSLVDSLLIQKEIRFETDSVNRHLTTEFTELDTVSGEWKFYLREVKEYDLNGSEVTWGMQTWDTLADGWRHSFITGYENDSCGHHLREIKYYWDSQQESWNENQKMERAYDSLGNLVLHSSFYWGWDPEGWVNSSNNRYEYMYDSIGNIMEETIYSGSPAQWDPKDKFENTYDTAGQRILEEKYYWNGLEWVLLSKKEFGYDAGGNKVLETRYLSYQGGWMEDIQIVDAYDEQGRHSLHELYYWDFATNVWMISYSNQYAYNDSGELITWIYSKRPAYGEPLDILKHEYTYDLHGETGITVTSGWDTTSMAFVLTEKRYRSAGHFHFNQHDAICEGNSLFWQGDEHEIAGTYHADFVSVLGTDSTYMLDLKVNPVPGESFTLTGDTSLVVGETGHYLVTENAAVTYYWKVENGSMQTGDPGNSMEVVWSNLGEGTVGVYPENQFGCSGDTAWLQVNIGPTGIVDQLNPGIMLYPVPVRDILRIISNLEYIDVDIVDLKGRSVLTSIENVLDMSFLDSGVYLVRINDRTGELISTQKIMKE
ncbi:MAG: T9SS type A sorting domain-containing protein [Bacteroidales bacterium]|nr:T9SS type A sorting domain-containing protein [Bacteroidales bacterium]